MEWIADSQIWISLLTLTALEIILGIDNVVVIALLSNRLPAHQQEKARKIGISLALITRVLLLLSIAWLAGLTEPLFTALGREVSIRDLILIAGGVFLLYKGTHEIHGTVEGYEDTSHPTARTTFSAVILQIIIFDIVFSLDSVITAIGMAQEVWVMIAAIVIAMAIMLFSAATVSRFIHKHPSLKMLALSFLLMIGVVLIAEGLSFHIPKGYIYFAMGFSALVETLNILAKVRRMKKKEVTT